MTHLAFVGSGALKLKELATPSKNVFVDQPPVCGAQNQIPFRWAAQRERSMLISSLTARPAVNTMARGEADQFLSMSGPLQLFGDLAFPCFEDVPQSGPC